MEVTDLKPDTSKRARRTVMFSLNLLKSDEAYAQQILEWWKAKRKMVTFLHQAIILFYELQQGSTDRLAATFPNVFEAIRADAIVEVKAEAASTQFNTILRELNALKEQQGRALPPPTAPRQPVSGGVVVAEGDKASAADVAKNFLSSMSNLGFFD